MKVVIFIGSAEEVEAAAEAGLFGGADAAIYPPRGAMLPEAADTGPAPSDTKEAGEPTPGTGRRRGRPAKGAGTTAPASITTIAEERGENTTPPTEVATSQPEPEPEPEPDAAAILAGVGAGTSAPAEPEETAPAVSWKEFTDTFGGHLKEKRLTADAANQIAQSLGLPNLAPLGSDDTLRQKAFALMQSLAGV